MDITNFNNECLRQLGRVLEPRPCNCTHRSHCFFVFEQNYKIEIVNALYELNADTLLIEETGDYYLVSNVLHPPCIFVKFYHFAAIREDSLIRKGDLFKMLANHRDEIADGTYDLLSNLNGYD